MLEAGAATADAGLGSMCGAAGGLAATGDCGELAWGRNNAAEAPRMATAAAAASICRFQWLTRAAGCAAVGKGMAPPWAFAAALVLHAAMAPWLFASGNVVSILRPKAASFAIQRNSALSTFSGLIGMGIVSATMGAFAVPALLALRAESPAILVGGWVALGIAGAVVLRALLPREARLLADRRDEFLPAVCGDDA